MKKCLYKLKASLEFQARVCIIDIKMKNFNTFQFSILTKQKVIQTPALQHIITNIWNSSKKSAILHFGSIFHTLLAFRNCPTENWCELLRERLHIRYYMILSHVRRYSKFQMFLKICFNINKRGIKQENQQRLGTELLWSK